MRASRGITSEFPIGIGLHQVMDDLSLNCLRGSPLVYLLVDDIVLVDEIRHFRI